MDEFLEKLDEIIDGHLAAGGSNDDVLSALELKLMALKEQAGADDVDE